MNGLSTRNTLHAFNARHAGPMPEMDAIRRCDTVRQLRDVAWRDELTQEDDQYRPEVIIVYAAAAVVLLVVGIVAWWL